MFILLKNLRFQDFGSNVFYLVTYWCPNSTLVTSVGFQISAEDVSFHKKYCLLVENENFPRVPQVTKEMKSLRPIFFIRVEDWHGNDKLPVSVSTLCPTSMILGVLCNVAIWKDSEDGSRPILFCGKIFDFGILLTICLEISFLMIITSEPITVM